MIGCIRCIFGNFYPRPPRGGRPLRYARTVRRSDFYPRPPRGGRQHSLRSPMRSKAFLSTPSARRATASGGLQKALKNISIHALREEGDCRHSGSGPAGAHFYPRPPRGGRPETAGLGVHRCYFYPRPPRGGRRKGRGACIDHILISIHALREEGDRAAPESHHRHQYFYPRPPRGRRLVASKVLLLLAKFLSTPSARRATGGPAS